MEPLVPRRAVQKGWVDAGVGKGQGRGKGAKDRKKGKRGSVRTDRPPPARYLLLIGHKAVDTVPTQ